MQNHFHFVKKRTVLPSLRGCTEKQVSTDIPYTVQIKQIRSYYKALDIEQRLEGMGVSTYIISEATDDGDWYRIVTGAEKSLADIQELKKKIQMENFSKNMIYLHLSLYF